MKGLIRHASKHLQLSVVFVFHVVFRQCLPSKVIILGMHRAQLLFTGGQGVGGLVAQLPHLLPQDIGLPGSAPHLHLQSLLLTPQ